MNITVLRRARRRFTQEEDQIIRDDFGSYIPTIEIARKIGRDEGTLRQRILFLKLRRSHTVSRLLAWAPEHLKSQLPTLSAQEFVAACYAWRESQPKELAEQESSRLDAAAADINQRNDLSRNQKLIAKRMLGMTLESIGRQHSLTRERVRQLTDPEWVANKGMHRDRPIVSALQKLDAKRSALIESELDRLLATWESCPPEVRERFLKQVQATNNDK